MDQIYLSNTGECRPVDCSTKYGGTKPFYKQSTGLCERSMANQCTIQETYDSNTNECVKQVTGGQIRRDANVRKQIFCENLFLWIGKYHRNS